MRRGTLVAVAVFSLAARAGAQNARVEIGIDGVCPAGEWVNCRVSGLDNVPDGTLVSVTVSDMFVREMRVARGRAEGRIIIPDEAPSIALDVAGVQCVRVPPEDLARLKCVMDKLPVVVIGDNAPEALWLPMVIDAPEVVPIQMSTDEFFRRKPADYAWVHAFFIGDLSADQVERLRDYLPLNDAVIAAFPKAIQGWLTQLPFEDTMCFKTCNKDLAPHLGVPRGSIRPDLYEIFGPPKWTETSRRAAALGFGAVLLAAALYAIRPARFVSSAAAAGAFVAAVLLIGVVVRRFGVPPPPIESVSLLEGVSSVGWQTEIYSRFSPTPGVEVRDWPDDVTPVASRRGQWLERPVLVDEGGRIARSTDAPVREVALRVRPRPMETPREGEYCILGDRASVSGDADAPRAEGRVVSLDELLRTPLHPNRRVDEIRRGLLRYWATTRPRVSCRLGWTPASTDGRMLSAGTLVVRALDSTTR